MLVGSFGKIRKLLSVMKALIFCWCVLTPRMTPVLPLCACVTTYVYVISCEVVYTILRIKINRLC